MAEDSSRSAAGQRYVALLRGVNVGGHGTLKMADLRAQFEALGFADVATYIQSGNVLFRTQEADAGGLARRIEEQLARSLGYRGAVFLLTREQLAEALAHNPFEPDCLAGSWSCQTMFLSAAPEASRREALMAVQGEDYRFAVHDRVLYYAYPRATEGRRRTINFEKVLGVTGTARNAKVVRELLGLAG